MKRLPNHALNNFQIYIKHYKNTQSKRHIVGYDIYDCVFATAQEAFDLDYFTYIIEECADTKSNAQLRDGVIGIMRELCMTNNSLEEKISFQEIE